MTVRTRASLAGDLRRLGLRPGDTVLVHASLRSLGPVCGGPTAVVQALLDVVGPAGTLVVPTQTPHNRDPATWNDPVFAGHVETDEAQRTIRAQLPGFDPAVTPSQGMGVIAEQVRTWPGARRSAHPQTSFGAVGPRAVAILDGHRLESPLGEYSPLARLDDVDARVLLLGVGMDRATIFHLAEYRLPDVPLRMNGCATVSGSERQWVEFQGIVLNDRDFAQLGKAFEAETPHVVVGAVGSAAGRLFSARSAVLFAEKWLRTNRVADSTPARPS